MNSSTQPPVSLRPIEIASWFHSGDTMADLNPPIIASVPKLQRGLVWNAGQSELLWDSLLRGFPIGSLVTCIRIPGQDDGDDPAVTHHLLDGQQRSHAISLGFQDPFAIAFDGSLPDFDSILWLDLQPEIPQYSTRDFLPRLTTCAHPWGFDKSDQCNPLGAQQIRDTLALVNLDPAHPEYERPRPIALFPSEAKCPVPMAWLLNQAFQCEPEFWLALRHRAVKCPAHWASKAITFFDDATPEAEASRRQIYDAINRIHFTRIVALPAPDTLVSETHTELLQSGAAGENSAIEHLFQRLNRQGTRLDDEELAYSMIKAYWPEVAAPVQQIVVRRMPASRLVMMAARAALTPVGSDNLRGRLTVTDIRRLAVKRDTEASQVLDFIQTRLVNCCEWIENMLLFDETHPAGLLPVHLAHIARSSPEIYLLLLCLADRCLRANDDMLTPEILRQSLLSLTCRLSWFATDSTKAANHILKASGDALSPDLIREAIAYSEKEGWLVPLPTPGELADFIQFDEGNLESWTWYSLIQGDGDQEGIDIRHAHWQAFLDRWGNRDLLLYAQRAFLNRRFHNFDPSRRDLWEGHNRPWDLDHIHASAFVYNKRNRAFQRFLYQWLNTPGNLRAWPFEDNRSDSAAPADEKIFTPQQMKDSFLTQEELAGFSLGHSPLDNETSARQFAKACRNRYLRIYEEWWKNIVLPTCPSE